MVNFYNNNILSHFKSSLMYFVFQFTCDGNKITVKVLE